jgi:hypothetical protein
MSGRPRGRPKLPRSLATSKTCRGPCGQTKPLEGFYAKATNADGLDGTCCECRKAAALARQRSFRIAYGVWPGHQAAKDLPRALELLGMLSLGE